MVHIADALAHEADAEDDAPHDIQHAALKALHMEAADVDDYRSAAAKIVSEGDDLVQDLIGFVM